jgi:signal recognition particle subunit SEC65
METKEPMQSLPTFFVGVLKRNYNKELILSQLNSTFELFITEMIGRRNLSGGLLTIYGPEFKNLLLIRQDFFEDTNLTRVNKIYERFSTREIKSIFEELGLTLCHERNCKHPEHPYEFINPNDVSFDKVMPDRRELDKIIFEILELTEKEQLEVYRAVVELVKNRLVKARSV